MVDSLEESSLRYHRQAPAGKLTVSPTKPLANALDLAQAYSPGVAYPCLRIKDDASQAAVYTARGNLVGVVSNGSAVLGLGAIGPLVDRAERPQAGIGSVRSARWPPNRSWKASRCCSRSLPVSTRSTSR